MHEILFDIRESKELLRKAKKWKYDQVHKERKRIQRKVWQEQRPYEWCDICQKSYKLLAMHKQTLRHINKAANPLEEAAKTNLVIRKLIGNREDERYLLDTLREREKKDKETIESLRSEIANLEIKRAQLEGHIDLILQ